MSHDLRELLQKGALSLLMRIGGGLVGFVMTAVTTRTLGAADSGLFFLGITIVTVLATFARLGLDAAMTRFIGGYADTADWLNVNRVYRAALPLLLLASLLLSGCLLCSSGIVANRVFNKPNLEAVLKYMSLLVGAVALYRFHGNCYQGLREMVRFQWYQNLGHSAIFLFLLLLLSAYLVQQHRAPTLDTFCQAYLVAGLIAAGTALFGWIKHDWFRWKQVVFERRTLLQVAIPLLGVAALGQFILWLPQLILGTTRSQAEFSIYNSAYRTAQLTSLVLMAGNSIALPKLAALQPARIHTIATRYG